MSSLKNGITPTAPVNYFLNVTARCNLNCIYCSSPGLGSGADELTLDDYRHLARQFDELGTFRIILTGGEPLVRDDFWDLVELLRPGRRSIALNTNGALIDRDTARRLKQLPIRNCAISLDAADEDVNAATRGPGTLQSALQAIEHLQSEGVPTGISTTLTRYNFAPRHIKQLAGLGRDLGISVSLGYITRMGRAGSEDSEFELNLQERLDTARYVTELRREYPSINSNVVSFPLSEQRGTGATILPCGAAKMTVAITADGWVVPCNKMPDLRCGNVKETPITEIWNAPPMVSVRSLNGRPTTDIPDCADCRHVGYCSGGCRADALLATGELLRRSPVCYAYSPGKGGRS